jgi:outer membrane biogenesis lipoprotein LolB
MLGQFMRGFMPTLVIGLSAILLLWICTSRGGNEAPSAPAPVCVRSHAQTVLITNWMMSGKTMIPITTPMTSTVCDEWRYPDGQNNP